MIQIPQKKIITNSPHIWVPNKRLATSSRWTPRGGMACSPKWWWAGGAQAASSWPPTYEGHTNMFIWDGEAGITTSMNEVTDWDDQGSNAYETDQTNASFRPAYPASANFGSIIVPEFDRTNPDRMEALTTKIVTSGSDFSVTMACIFTAVSANEFYTNLYAGDQDSTYGVSYSPGTFGGYTDFGLYNTGGSSPWGSYGFNISGGIVQDRAYIWTAIWKSSGAANAIHYLWDDNSRTTTLQTTIASGGAAPSQNTTVIGAMNNGVGSFAHPMTGPIAYIIGYTGELSSANVSDLHNQIVSRSGI